MAGLKRREVMGNYWALAAPYVKEVVLIWDGMYQPSSQATDHVRRRWQEHGEKLRRENKEVPNRLALRLRKFVVLNTMGVLELFIEEGSYSDYYGTCLDSDFRNSFPRRDWFTALCLGALPVTNDGYFCLGQRGLGEIQSPGRIDMPMGHPWELSLTAEDMVRAKVAFELGIDVFSIKECQPMALVREDPIEGLDLVCTALLGLNRAEVEKANPPGAHKKRYFLKADAYNIREFLYYACVARFRRLHVSPPVVPALALWGRDNIGEEWYESVLPIIHR